VTLPPTSQRSIIVFIGLPLLLLLLTGGYRDGVGDATSVKKTNVVQ